MFKADSDPKWGPIGKEVYERTYQRTKEDGTKETWEDTVNRVVSGNTALVDERFIEPDEREKLFKLIYNMNMLPAGRHLWVTGVPGRQYVFNCHRAGFERNMASHFTFMFDQLMQGGGVGANYSQRYLDEVEAPSNEVELHIVCREDHPDYEELLPFLSTEYSAPLIPLRHHHKLDDSREGWVFGLDRVIDAHFLNYYTTVVLDVSDIRQRGALIKGFGGTACGPSPLANLLHRVNEILNKCVYRPMTGLEAMELDHQIATCVVAGNVRRSARMSIKSWLDEDIFEFIDCKAKDENGIATNHWSTNISVEIDDEFFEALGNPTHLLNNHANKVYYSVIMGMLRDGEPGFYNISLAQKGELGDVGSTNPCGEIALEPWENCNLGHINLDRYADNPEAAREAFRLMTRFLIRATFSDIVSDKQREVVKRNRRIGVGFFGFQSWLVKNHIKFSDSHRSDFARLWLKEFKRVVDAEKISYADQLRIPIPIKGTTLAPTGTIAQLAGSTQSIQTVYSPYFIRRVRYAANDPSLQEFIDGGYEIEDCIYSENTKVVKFYCEDSLTAEAPSPELVEGAADVSFEDFLAVQAMVQELYADNAISFTINIVPGSISVEQAAHIMKKYLPRLKGTTVFPDMSRPQSPLERISKAEYDLAEYIKSVGQGELACGPNGCPVK